MLNTGERTFCHRARNAAGDAGGDAQNAQIDKDCRGLQRHGGNAQLAYIVQHGGKHAHGHQANTRHGSKGDHADKGEDRAA